MKIDGLALGAYETNCYVLRSSEAAKDCLIVDAGLGADKLIKFLQEHNLNPIAVVLTHGHIDHIEGVAALRTEFPDGNNRCICSRIRPARLTRNSHAQIPAAHRIAGHSPR